MNKKTSEAREARDLRASGHSLNDIAKRLNVSKGSVSAWVKGISLSEGKKKKLNSNGHTQDAINKRRKTRLKNEKAKRDKTRLLAKKRAKRISKEELWMIGTMLYWAEGGKTQRMVRFSNGDPEMIRVMMRYFIEVCEVSKSKIKGYIHIHEHLDFEAAEKYWQEVSGIQQENFYKTFRKKRTKSKRTTLPYGVMDIYILNTELFLQIKGWTEGLFENINENK